jgi:magnesium and cobalt exporter, CNNM family
MLLLIIYVLIALGFSFLCSIAEAVLLSVTVGYIAVMERENKPSGVLLRNLKEDINKPLAAILTLNTIAHTVGAAGAGAQATVVFGNAYLGIVSAVLTLLILVISEIIPKTLGAHYWQSLAPTTAYCVRALVWLLYPFVKLSEYLTRSIVQGPGLRGFNRDEFTAMAELSWQDGLLARQESKILMNLLSLHEVKVEDVMTPQSVMFSIPEVMTAGEYCEQHKSERFSRIPVYADKPEKITGFVLLNDLLLAQARGETDQQVSCYKRELPAVLSAIALSKAFDQLLQQRAIILLVVDEYGGVQGLLTLEDVLETILGLEIVDEGDKSKDMQELARRFWRRRVKAKGLKIDEEIPKE